MWYLEPCELATWSKVDQSDLTTIRLILQDVFSADHLYFFLLRKGLWLKNLATQPFKKASKTWGPLAIFFIFIVNNHEHMIAVTPTSLRYYYSNHHVLEREVNYGEKKSCQWTNFLTSRRSNKLTKKQKDHQLKNSQPMTFHLNNQPVSHRTFQLTTQPFNQLASQLNSQ